jgi:hypothetical protein
MDRAVIVLGAALIMSFIPSLSEAQTKAHQKPAPVPPATVVDDLAAARGATDTFLKGIKIADLPEGREMLREVQWITGELEIGLYEKPTFTEDTTVFEKLFDTDIPGVQGYKRLVEMTAVSEARTPLLVRFVMIAYKDQQTKKWKVLFTGTGVRIDIDKMVTEIGNDLRTPTHSEQFIYQYYGFWLVMAGRIKEAQKALTTSLSARTTYTDLFDGSPREDDSNTTHRQLFMARSLLTVIGSVTGNNADTTEHP